MRKKKSGIIDAVHEAAQGLYNAGVMDQLTMRKFDQLCCHVDKQRREQRKQQSLMTLVSTRNRDEYYI
jgi:DNA-binding transcriptional regulator YiaG